ncbi:MAG: radical SAM protein [Chloroflexi bacterium]|nr:radical SAM protein [Chloroflexota bacterium]
MAQSLEALLDSLTMEGTLYERLPDNAVRCYACGHRCLIKEGRRGICQVRFNEGGTLKVPWGYVGALQCDPTEKKPFFHIYPGSDTLTFGMLGCDFHCAYCLSPNTHIATSEGTKPIASLFAEGRTLRRAGDEEVRRPTREVAVYTRTGQARRVEKLFRHPYRGQMKRIRAWYLPPLECTPEHELLATTAPSVSPQFVQSGRLTPDHLLAVPKRFAFSHSVTVNTAELLKPLVKPYHVEHTINRETLAEVLQLSAEGLSSREIGGRIGKEASHVRHLRSKLNRGVWDLERLGKVNAGLTVEDGYVRLPKEHRPGIPLALALDTRLAKLLGYYCAEGCVVRSKDRVHSAVLNFSFGHHEESLADEVIGLLNDVFGVQAQKVYRETTVGVAVSKASIALCFESLCGHGARTKRVPPPLFEAHREVADAFLRAYAEGDGSTRANGLTQIHTVSEELAHGVAWLALKLGMLPSLSRHHLGDRPILGRQVKASPYQYAVNWYFGEHRRKFAFEDDNHWYVRIRGIETFDYDGDVYNLQVEGEHSYLANLLATHNCQNWQTSQTLRDDVAGAPPQIVTPQELVNYGLRAGAKLVGSSYNEPLITSEWAVAVFKEAGKHGLQCVYISNGNVTRDALEHIRPYTIGYKIDLKSMSDKRYRQLGGVLRNTLDGIKLAKEMGFWVEVVTLVIPGFNDSNEELMEAAQYIESVSPEIPWHVTAFHPDYKMTEPDPTRASTLIRAAEIGQEAGLQFVYAGNLSGQVGEYENTFCPSCNHKLIARYGYVILDYQIADDGCCPNCKAAIPGIWPKRAEVRLGTTGDLYRRVPRRVR